MSMNNGPTILKVDGSSYGQHVGQYRLEDSTDLPWQRVRAMLAEWNSASSGDPTELIRCVAHDLISGCKDQVCSIPLRL